MNDTDARTLLLEMGATWPQKELTKPERQVWLDTMGPVEYDAGRIAVAELRRACDWLPTHHQFLEAVTDAQRRIASGRGLPAGPEVAPRVCGLCEATGWMDVSVISGAQAVARCKCDKGKVNQEHKSGCTCSRCTYGPGAFAWSGRSGKSDPLRAVPVGRYDEAMV